MMNLELTNMLQHLFSNKMQGLEIWLIWKV